jgi:hypothetical protein
MLAGRGVREAVHVRPVEVDQDGAPCLNEDFLTSIGADEIIGLPGRMPTCEQCWTETAIAVAWRPGGASLLVGERCQTSVTGRSYRLVAISAPGDSYPDEASAGQGKERSSTWRTSSGACVTAR